MSDNFVVYKSSAGSGKTFTLVKEYLVLALQDNSDKPSSFKKILAITFTNKASAEMKFRIIEALKSLSKNQSKSDHLKRILLDELNLNEDLLIQRSTRLLSEILHNYSDFAISTIDSFTHKIVKSFAHDLKLPVNFNIETNTGDFYQKVISGLMSKIGENPELTDLLLQYVSNNANENSSWDPESKLLEFTSLLQKENAESNLLKLNQFDSKELKEIQSKTFAFIQEFKNTLKIAGNKALKLIEDKKLCDEHFIYGKTGPQRVFYKWSNISSEKSADLISSRTQETISKNKWENKNNSSEENNRIALISPALNEIGTSTMDYINKYGLQYNLFSLIDKNIYSIILLNELQQITEEFKSDEQIVFISEFNTKIAKIVAEEPAPFIYERLGERYHHYLLDEFQDTSTLQWLNLLPLIDNSLSMGKFNLIVGDGKQSIYRWRNANVQQFNRLPNLIYESQNPVIKEREDNLKRNFKEKVLDTNYRSLKNIVEFNNSVFDFLPNHIISEDYLSIYNKQKQNSDKKSGGYVTIHTGSTDKEMLQEHNFLVTKQHIENAIQSGFIYKDICVIVRSNHHGNNIANYLLENNIPVISSDSLLLKNNPEINCIISFLKYLNNPFDLISAASVLNYCFSKANLLSEALQLLSKTKNLFKVFNHYKVSIHAEDFIQKNVFDVCVHLTTTLQLEINNPQYLRFFLDEVNDYLVNKTGSINEFIIWWEKRQDQASLIIPEGVNAVKIMTIHKSKGLEFPVVILPFFNWETYKADNAWVNLEKFKLDLPVGVFNISKGISDAGLASEYEREKNEQYLDNLNLLYVAFTRAVERLHIISNKSESQKKETICNWIDLFINHSGLQPKNGFVEFGVPENKLLIENHKQTISFDISVLNFNRSKDLIKIKSSHKLKVSADTERALEKGIKMHYILSEINSTHEIQTVLGRMVTSGIITLNEVKDLERNISSLLSNTLICDYYSGAYKSKNEAELVTENGDILRPDKVVFNKDTAVIIDYKTGEINLKKHGQQMEKYSDALLKMGIKQTKKILVYLDENEIHNLA